MKRKYDSQATAILWRVISHLADAKRVALRHGDEEDYIALDSAITSVLHCKRMRWDGEQAARRSRSRTYIQHRLQPRAA